MRELFSHIFDQSGAIDRLVSTVEKDRLPHGIIFAGPRGVGKTTTAIALAKYFLCDKGKDRYAMGLIDNDNHPDFHRVEKNLVRRITKGNSATTLSIHVIRQFLIDPAEHTSYTGAGKVFVVEEADLMNYVAQFSVLKTLEEPLGRTLIIFVTDRPDNLLSTIRSRVPTITFGSLSRAAVANGLKLRGIEPHTADLAADLTDGSFGTAIQWVEDGVISRAGELIKQLDATLLGRGAPELAGWFKASADAYAARQLVKDTEASKDFKTREGLLVYLRLFSRRLRAALRQETATGETLERICGSITTAARTENYITSNVTISLALLQFGEAVRRQWE